MSKVRSDRGAYLLSGERANGLTGTNIIDARGMSDRVMVTYSGSALPPSAGGGSAIIELIHSHDLTAWTLIGRLTALESTAATAVFSSGPYAYLRARTSAIYSAAATGTAAPGLFVRPGMV